MKGGSLLSLVLLLHASLSQAARSLFSRDARTLLFVPQAGASALSRRGLLREDEPPWRHGVVMMGRKRSGDGKKKGGKKGSRDDDSDAEESDEAGAAYTPRVSSNINIPVKAQIRFAKQMKKLVQEDAARPAPPPKKVRIKKKEEGQRVGMSTDYAPFRPTEFSTILLVDGYNVINNWSKTIKARSSGGMSYARQALTEQLRYIYHARGWKVIVAFDEHTPGSELRVLEGDIDEVYTGETESADGYIERKAMELSRKRPVPHVMIATDDRAIQVTSATCGAKIMSTSSLIKDIYVARKELLHRRTNEWKDGERRVDDADDYFSYNWDSTIR